MLEKESNNANQMYVRKRDGSSEPVDINKIVRAVSRCAQGISEVDPALVAIKTIGGLYDGISTRALDEHSIKTAASLIPENANYSKLAAMLLAEYIRKEVARHDVHTFSQSITLGHSLGLITDELFSFASANARKLDNAIKDEHNASWEYWGIRSVYEGHLLRHPQTGDVIETPQQMLMRIAASESKSVRSAIDRYKRITKNEPLTPKGAQWFMRGTKLWEDAQATISTAIETISFRPLKPGMGQAVAERTVLRKKADGSWENWGDVAEAEACVCTVNSPYGQVAMEETTARFNSWKF